MLLDVRYSLRMMAKSPALTVILAVTLALGISSDTFVQFPFLPAIKPGQYGPIFEVRTYLLKPNGLGPTIAAWEKAVPGREKLSPILAAMYSVTGKSHASCISGPIRASKCAPIREKPPSKPGSGRRPEVRTICSQCATTSSFRPRSPLFVRLRGKRPPHPLCRLRLSAPVPRETPP